MPEYRRRLPHIQPEGAWLFVTWRLHGSLPSSPPLARFATAGEKFAALDRALDRDRRLAYRKTPASPTWFQPPFAMVNVRQDLYELLAWVVMPNHVHLLIQPRVTLSRITHSLKGSTARKANLILGRTSEPFWQESPTTTG
jgi:putative transposase